NTVAIQDLISHLEPCSDVSLVGITDSSFQRPFLILQARIGCDPGFFGQNLKKARQILLHEWKKRSKALKAGYKQTDVLGITFLAQDLFQQRHSESYELVFYSDMRHVARGLDLESPSRLNVQALLETVKANGWIPCLPNVSVSVLGVHASGKDMAFWQQLKSFWTGFFEISGANIKIFSTQRRVSK